MEENRELNWDTVSGYLIRDLEMKANTDINRVQEIWRLGKNLCPEQLKAIFISNYLESVNKEQLRDLWLFSNDYVVECQNIFRMETPILEMAVYSKNIRSVKVETQKFDFSNNPTVDSKLRISFITHGRFGCDFLALGQNCQKLKVIYDNHIKDNIVRGQSAGLI